ncbi:hypothetical protein WDW86_01320 [Bdellovibrionota bacterium FG-2]
MSFDLVRAQHFRLLLMCVFVATLVSACTVRSNRTTATQEERSASTADPSPSPSATPSETATPESAPVIFSLSSSTNPGSYTLGASIDVSVLFSTAVLVSGTPTLSLNSASPFSTATYASGSGSDTLHFIYQVQAGDTASPLNLLTTPGLELNGGAIRTDGGTAADLTLPAVDSAQALPGSAVIVVDTTAPANTSGLAAVGGVESQTVIWSTNGDAAGYVLVRRPAGAVTWVPTPGESYSAGPVDSDHTIAYIGALSSLSDLSLASNTSYYYSLYSYDSAKNYCATPATISGSTFVSTWTSVDGGAATGINADPAKNAFSPRLATLDSKIYAVWVEVNGSAAPAVRVAVNNGSNSIWDLVDGGGLNIDPTLYAEAPAIIVFNNELYVGWTESDGVPLFSRYQLHVKKYNGNDSAPGWSNLNGGISLNKNSLKDAFSPNFVIFGSKLYLAWMEAKAAFFNIRIRDFDGASWSFVDGDDAANGININSDKDANTPFLFVFEGKLYVTWAEQNAANKYQVRIAQYNGVATWELKDGTGANGINKDVTKNAANYPYGSQLASANSILYATWTEDDGLGNYQVHVSAYNGNDLAPVWSLVDPALQPGLNRDAAYTAIGSVFTTLNSRLYLFWHEMWASGTAIHASVFDNGVWSAVDGSTAYGLTQSQTGTGSTPNAIAANSKFYLIWGEDNPGQIRVKTGN